MKNGARISVAAAAVGLSLAGPLIAGTATADSGEPDAATTSEVSAGPARSAADRTGPARRPVGDETARTRGSRIAVRAPLPAAARTSTQTPTRPSGPGVSAQRLAGDPAPAAAPDSGAVARAGAAVDTLRAVRLADAERTPLPAEPPVAAPVPALTAADAKPAVSRTGAPAAARMTIATDPRAGLNAAVTNAFDAAANWLATLPGGPAAEFLQGTLMLLRRGLFNQLPTADPAHYLTTVSGGQVGTLGLVDPEADALSYTLTRAPEFGTVQIGADGTYTYIPDYRDATADAFTVTVLNPGFNLLDPFGARTTEVVVAIPGDEPAVSATWTKTFDLKNLTPYTLKVTDILKEKGYETDVLTAPPLGTLVKPGETVHFKTIEYSFLRYDTRTVLRACLNDDCSRIAPDAQGSQLWLVRMRTSGSGSFAPPTGLVAERGDLLVGYDQLTSNALVEAPGTTRTFDPTDRNAVDFFNALMAISGETRLLDPTSTVDMNNVEYLDAPPEASDYGRAIAADNPGDGTAVIKKSVSESFSTTKGTNWEANAGVSFTPIVDVLTLSVSAKYGGSSSTTTTKTFTAEVSQTGQPWSANEILKAPPKLLVNGDAVITLGTNYNTARLPNVYTFRDVEYYFPSQVTDEALWVMRSEPLSDRVGGVPRPNQGFTVKDKASVFLSPTYTVGQRAQLTAEAYNGAVDKTLLTTYTSSNPAVAVVDASGKLSAVGVGTTVITARYDWSMPIGDGKVRDDYVQATMTVTVTRR